MTHQTDSSKKISYWLLTAVGLLILTASRFLRLHEIQMNPDEIWSIWQTFGTLDQIIQWAPYDWPPLYYLSLGVWWRSTSLIPQSLRLFSMLIFLIGAAFTYKIGQRLGGLHTAIGTTLVYAALGYNILLSIEVRGYALLLGLMPLAFWLMLRYFETGKRWYGILLGLVLAAMFYTSYTSTLAIVMLGVYSAIIYRRKIIQWWLPAGITFILILREILQIRRTVSVRVTATSQLDTPELFTALYDLFTGWAGTFFGVWVILFLVASGLLLYHQRFSRHSAALFIWVVLMPVVLYFSNSLLGFFSARYSWWVMLGIALWLGWGLAQLPQLLRLGAYAILVIFMFLPLPMERYSIWGSSISPLGRNFEWLTEHLQWGDLMIADRGNNCGRVEEWDYYTRLYFPNGLHFAQEPGDQRRVWYMLEGGRQDQELEQRIAANRVLVNQVGPSRCLFMLYESPPLAESIAFANGLRFHGADIVHEAGYTLSGYPAFHEGDRVRLRLWWTVDQPLDQAYSVGTYVGFRDGVYGPFGSLEALPRITYPNQAETPIEQWQPGQYYIEEREFNLRPALVSGRYTIFLAVTDPATGERITGTGLTEDNTLQINQLTVKSY